ncbi:hypothetical protein [Streptomyces sp. NPDC049949]|uniref:hypothetical protein n=1 Tax=Streptomyces sp. NPDC049949 TaxID=3154627 RepID=UPI00342C4E72
MRTTIRGAVLAAGTLIALSGLVTAAAAEPLAACTPNSRPTARGVCLPAGSLKDLGLGMLISKSPDCASNEFCVFPPLLRSPEIPALRNG